MRTAQEALVNTAKHAPNQPVTRCLRYDDDQVRLQIGNELSNELDSEVDGAFSTVNGGFGLTGMRERLLLIHGTLTITADQHRWKVSAEVPR